MDDRTRIDPAAVNGFPFSLGAIEAEDLHQIEKGTARSRLAIAQGWIKARRARDQALGKNLFADPAWEMLLDLYVSRCRSRKVSVSDICLVSSVPMTTALRWLALLEDQGLLRKEPDQVDGRRVNILFTTEGLRKMELALDGAADRQ